LITKPSQFSEKELGDIYTDHIKRIISNNLDSGYVLFDEMVTFGLKHQSSLFTALAYNNKAIMYLMMRNPEKSFPYLKKALPLARNYPDAYINVLYYLSLNYRSMGNIDIAMMMLDTVEVLSSSGKVSTKKQASYFISREKVLSYLNKYHSAIESYQMHQVSTAKMKIHSNILILYSEFLNSTTLQ